MEYDEPLEDDLEDVPDDDDLVADEELPMSVKKAIEHERKSARRLIEERLERKRLRHEVDYLSDLDEDEDDFNWDDIDSADD